MAAVKQIVPEPPVVGELDDLRKASGEAVVDRSAFDDVVFSGTSIKPICAANVCIEGSRVVGSVFAGSKLPGVGVVDCAFDRGDLAGAKWDDARLVRVRFNECRLTGFDAWGADLRDVVFDGCKMPEAVFANASFTRVRFEKCQLGSLDMGEAKIHSLAIHDCDARSLRLAGARIELLDLRGSLIDGIGIDQASIKGIVIDSSQAPAIASAMGVRVIQ